MRREPMINSCWRKIIFSGLLIVLALGLASCSSYPSTTTPTGSTTPTSTPASTPTSTQTTPPSPGSVTIDLTAKNVAFDKKTITVPAGASVTINFSNQDSGVPHNFALYNDSSASQPAIFVGQIITGPITTTYTFTAPATPGKYFFRCDIHPTQMFGDFIVQ